MVDEALTRQPEWSRYVMSYHQQSLVVPTKMALVGIVIGAISGLAVAQLHPGPTLAAVVANPPFNIGKALDTNLAKFNGAYYAIGTEPGISMDAESSATVRKIGYGQTSFVTVNKTSTGTYSSDGLASPYVRYPGIYSVPLTVAVSPFGAVLGWSRLSGWVRIPLFSARSIGFLDDDRVPASHDGVCVTDNDTGGCR
jgi:hypothetical protein